MSQVEKLFLPLNPATMHILLPLAREERHGYRKSCRNSRDKCAGITKSAWNPLRQSPKAARVGFGFRK